MTPAQVEQIRRTVYRVPEVVVKVLPRGSNDLQAVGKHLEYIGRQGDLELEGDGGEQLQGWVGKELLEDWDLELDEVRPQGNPAAASVRMPPKLVHKLMFSMPPGTPPNKVLDAVRNFAREQFALQHRYAFVLHADEPHPHVHLVLKAVSEQGVRLNIKKATLRQWRSEFALQLRQLGVAANATERAVRGETRSAKKDGIYRAGLRGDSTYMRAQAEAVAAELVGGGARVEPGKKMLLDTRAEVTQGWRAVVDRMVRQGDRGLAIDVARFANDMDQPQTDKELMAKALVGAARVRRREAMLPN
jgi:hypothetical protein